MGWKGEKSNLWETCAPGRELRKKGRLHGRTSNLGSERFKSQSECCGSDVLWRGAKPPWLVGGPLRLTEGLKKPELALTDLPSDRAERNLL